MKEKKRNYNRPKIRDLLNILAAIADSADVLALFVLLRSPAFAIPEGEIYQLHFSPPRQEPRRGPPFGDDVVKGWEVRIALCGS